jgi:hypothetical protein
MLATDEDRMTARWQRRWWMSGRGCCPPRVLLAATLLALLLPALPRPAAAEGSASILLLSRAGTDEDVSHYVEFLLGTLGERAPLHGAALARQIESRLSAGPGPLERVDLASTVARGRRLFLEGEFPAAIDTLESARRALRGRTALVAADPQLRDAMHSALLLLAHAHLRNDQRDKARSRIIEALRSFPDRDLSLVQHGPELAAFFREVRRELGRQRQATLHVATRPAGCSVFVNERYVGLSPVRVAGLYPGRYRIYLQRGQELGRVSHVRLSGVDRLVQIHFGLDTALRTDAAPSLRFTDAAAQRRHEAPYAAAVGKALEAPSVLLLGVRRHQGRKALYGATVSAATGAVARAAMVLLEPAPAPPAMQALGRYLIAGEEGAAVIVLADDRGQARPPRPGFFSARVFKWIALGAAVAALASGITLVVLHGRGTCGEPGTCPDRYNTLVAGATLTAAGGAAAVTSGVLFYLDARRPRAEHAVRLAPSPTPGGAGLSAALTW